MEDNLTMAQEEIVHENSYIELLPGHPILRTLIDILCAAALIALLVIGQ